MHFSFDAVYAHRTFTSGQSVNLCFSGNLPILYRFICDWIGLNFVLFSENKFDDDVE